MTSFLGMDIEHADKDPVKAVYQEIPEAEEDSNHLAWRDVRTHRVTDFPKATDSIEEMIFSSFKAKLQLDGSMTR
jgi:hypothetical protein